MYSIVGVSGRKIKETAKLRQKKYRDELDLFIAEGEKSFEELISAGIKIKYIFVLNDYDTRNINHEFFIVNKDVMKKISTADSPCNILAVAEKKHYDLNMFKKHKRVLLLENISDPGNLGTIIRSASAFNFDGIVLYGNCTDLYSSKVIRSTAGNFFKIPVIEIKNKDKLNEIFKSHIKISTSLRGKNTVSLEECSKYDSLLIMMGSEAAGLSSELINLSDKNVKLAMAKDVESLNLAVSASIIMHEIFNGRIC